MKVTGSKTNGGCIGRQELDDAESLRSFKELGSFSLCDGKLLEAFNRGGGGGGGGEMT